MYSPGLRVAIGALFQTKHIWYKQARMLIKHTTPCAQNPHGIGVAGMAAIYQKMAHAYWRPPGKSAG